MDEDKQQPDREKGTGPQKPTPFDGEVGESPASEPAQQDIFSSLVEFAAAPGRSDAGGPPGALLQIRPAWLSHIQKTLIAGIVLIVAALVYVLVARMTSPASSEHTASAESSAGEQTSTSVTGRRSPLAQKSSPAQGQARPGEGDTTHDLSPLGTPGRAAGTPDLSGQMAALEPPVQTVESSVPNLEPLSLQLADKLYVRRDFEHALATYDKLHRRLPASEENQPLRDFLLLRMALCSKNSGPAAQADNMLRTVSLSRWPILRALARYHQGTTLLSRKRYLEAAARAYQTIALIEVLDYDQKWISAVRQQCGALIAEALTRNVLALCDADANLPPELWSEHLDLDPFVNVEEPQLRVFLASGADQLDGAVLRPQIRSTGPSPASRWSVLCNGASIEELLARFATNAGLNVGWTDSGQPAPIEDNVRARPVCLCLTSATPQQVVTTATGSVGLLARMDDKGNVRVLDPASYSSLADHTKLLAEESMSLWQRLLLTAQTDPRAANAHYALGLLETIRGQFDEALAEYKLVANRFAKHALAPHALLQSGRLKVRLRDYVGAHADLKQLVELYPETELSDRASLYLADATMKAGLYAEATGLYRKVYNLGLSVESQTASALGAGRCFHETGDHEEAAQWLSQYVSLARDQNRPDFYGACLLLGKTYLALHKPQQAHAALNLALKGELSPQQYVETIAVLVRTYFEQGLYLEALNTLEGTGGWQLSQQESVDLLLLRAQAFRAIGLMEKAIVLLEGKGQYLPSPELQAKVALELARSYLAAGNLESARTTLGQAFAAVAPGPLAEQIGCELARACLRLGQTAQAVSVCSQLLARAGTSERPSILRLLADAYRRQGRHDQAVAAMLDRYETATDPNTAGSRPNLGITQQ